VEAERHLWFARLGSDGRFTAGPTRTDARVGAEGSRSSPPTVVVRDHRFLLIWEDGSTDPNRVVAVPAPPSTPRALWSGAAAPRLVAVLVDDAVAVVVAAVARLRVG